MEGEAMINFDIDIYMDALGLLQSDKTDIRAEILNQMIQGDPCVEQIGEDLHELAEELFYDPKKVDAIYGDMNCDKILSYVTIGDVTFDYGESEACGDRRICAFLVGCEFDADKWFEENIA